MLVRTTRGMGELYDTLRGDLVQLLAEERDRIMPVSKSILIDSITDVLVAAVAKCDPDAYGTVRLDAETIADSVMISTDSGGNR
jgi:hypothetical protein